MSDVMTLGCGGCGALGGEPCRLRAAWDPPTGVCERQAYQAAQQQLVPVTLTTAASP